MKTKKITGLLMIPFMIAVLLIGSADLAVPDSVSARSYSEADAVWSELEYHEGRENVGGAFTTVARAKLFGIPIKNIPVNLYGDVKLIPGGFAFGARLASDGVMIVATEENAKSVNPSKLAGLKVKDIIKSVNGKDVDTAKELNVLIESSEGKKLDIVYERDGELLSTVLTPVKNEKGVYHAGIWVKDSTAGIGTVTYIEPETLKFGGLGHGITEADTGAMLPMSYGEVFQAVITGVKRGKAGEPGELKGFIGRTPNGILYSNTDMGVFGKFDIMPGTAKRAIPIALKNEIKVGKCTVLCMPDGKSVKEYEAEITKIVSTSEKTKNFIIRITDGELLSLTGGVVQGMSGSPIIQNGKLVGAITHVLVNDPEKGYGIFIENMLEASR